MKENKRKEGHEYAYCSKILGVSVMASAVLGRIMHHCTIINIKGESFRLKDRRKNTLPTMRK